jgi:hypothetical protein
MDESPDESTAKPLPPAGDFAYLPALPKFRDRSPAVVVLHDKIRRELKDVDGFEEFCWFAREYPRCYRFHVDGAEFRLKSIHDLMRSLRADLAAQMPAPDGDTFECGLSNIRAAQVYWDFESFLSEVSIALDLLARVVGPAFREESPPSFNRLCKWSGTHPLLDLFRRAQTRWVNRLKDYRDCFTHYTPVDTMLMVVLRRYPDRWEVRAKLPTNPNVRDILGFRFSRRVELLRYTLRVHGDLMALDRAVARTLLRLYRHKQYPVRKDRLFFVGRRERVS